MLDIRVPQIVEANVRQSRLVQNRFHVRVGAVRRQRQLRSDRVWEDPLRDRILFSAAQNFRRAAGQDDGALTAAGLGLAQHIDPQLSAMKGAAHLQNAVPCVKVLPHESADLAPPQARGQLHVEEVTPYLVFPHGVQKGVQFFVGQDTFRRMACLWHRCAHGGILGDDMRVEGILHCLMEDGVEAVDGGIRQGGTKPRMLPDPPVLFQPPIEFLHILRCHQRHLLAAELRLDVVFNAASIPRRCAARTLWPRSPGIW